MPDDKKVTCKHGKGNGEVTRTLLLIWDDLVIFAAEEYNRSAKKKARARIFKITHRNLGGWDALKIESECYSIATSFILEGDLGPAYFAFVVGLKVKTVLSFDDKAMKYGPYNEHKIGNVMGLAKVLKKHIPCDSLSSKSPSFNQLHQKCVGLDNVIMCHVCKEMKPMKDMFQCSLCDLPTYCSEKCQHRHWKFHKKECKNLRRKKRSSSDTSQAKPSQAKPSLA